MVMIFIFDGVTLQTSHSSCCVSFFLAAWLVNVIRDSCWSCVSAPVESTVNVLRLAHSMVDPFVYSLRMPMFKDSLEQFQ